MKSITKSCAMIFAFTISVASCGDNSDKKIHIQGLLLNKTKITLEKGTSETLTATISPIGAAKNALVWKTNNEHIVAVSSTGEVSALKNGQAVVTVSDETEKVYASCDVNVITTVIGVLVNAEVMLAVGEKQRLTATVLPEDATNTNVIWQSSNENIVEVSAEGTVLGKAPGEATVTVTTIDQKKQAKCRIVVKSASTIEYHPFDEPKHW